MGETGAPMTPCKDFCLSAMEVGTMCGGVENQKEVW